MNDLTNRIEKRSRGATLIAAQNLTLQITNNASRQQREKELPKPFIDRLSGNAHEIEELSRIILLAGAVSSERVEAVRSAIRNVNDQNAKPDGTEAVVLATLGLLALRLLISKSEATEDQIIRIEDEDQKTILLIEENFSYEISSSLGQMLKMYFGNSGDSQVS
jgi:hypothetical protein